MSDAWGLHIEDYDREIGRKINPFGVFGEDEPDERKQQGPEQDELGLPIPSRLNRTEF